MLLCFSLLDIDNIAIEYFYELHLFTFLTHGQSIRVRPGKVLRIVPAHNLLTVKIVPRDAPEFTWIKR